MTPRQFLDDVVRPNVFAALARPDSLQAVCNAILTMDALVGIIFSYLDAKSDPSVRHYKSDEPYKRDLVKDSDAFRLWPTPQLRSSTAALQSPPIHLDS